MDVKKSGMGGNFDSFMKLFMVQLLLKKDVVPNGVKKFTGSHVLTNTCSHSDTGFLISMMTTFCYFCYVALPDLTDVHVFIKFMNSSLVTQYP